MAGLGATDKQIWTDEKMVNEWMEGKMGGPIDGCDQKSVWVSEYVREWGRAWVTEWII